MITLIEKAVRDYLTEQIEEPVFLEEPETYRNPAEPNKKRCSFVVIDKTGSLIVQHMLKRATIAVQSYADTKYEASVLNELVKAIMLNMIVENDICKVELISDYPFSKTETRQPRYQAVFEITYY
jgi:hypothetical protein